MKTPTKSTVAPKLRRKRGPNKRGPAVAVKAPLELTRSGREKSAFFGADTFIESAINLAVSSGGKSTVELDIGPKDRIAITVESVGK